MINEQNTNPRKIHVTAVFLSEISQSIVCNKKKHAFSMLCFMICQLFRVELLTFVSEICCFFCSVNVICASRKVEIIIILVSGLFYNDETLIE